MVYFGGQPQTVVSLNTIIYFRENKRAIRTCLFKKRVYRVFIQEAVLYRVSHDARLTFHWNYIFEFQSDIKKTKRVLKHTT